MNSKCSQRNVCIEMMDMAGSISPMDMMRADSYEFYGHDEDAVNHDIG